MINFKGMSSKNKKVLVPEGASEKDAYSHGIAVPMGDKEMIFVTGQIAVKGVILKLV